MRRSPAADARTLEGLDGARGGLLRRAKLAGAGERGVAVGALQPDAAAHAGDGVDDQAELFHGVATPGVYHLGVTLTPTLSLRERGLRAEG